jgi:hypothetical protein
LFNNAGEQAREAFCGLGETDVHVLSGELFCGRDGMCPSLRMLALQLRRAGAIGK